MILSDDDDDELELGGKTQPFPLAPPATPKKPKTFFKNRYSADDEESQFTPLNQPSTSFKTEGNVKKTAQIVKKKKNFENIVNLSEADNPLNFEKTTYFLGKNIYVENTVFKGIPYICLFRKEDGMIKNRFNLPLELGAVLKKAVNMIVDKIN